MGCYVKSVAKNSPFAYITTSHPSEQIRVYAKTVGQYTGLTDKNGKKIFEGDILHIKTGNGWTCPKGTDVYYKVVFTEFNEENADWAEYIGYMAEREEDMSSIHFLVNSYGAKVTGNIYDNPELLEDNNGQ